VIDVEPLVFILRQDPPLHRFFHTIVGALVVAVASTALILSLRWLVCRRYADQQRRWPSSGAVAMGALLGTLSHVALDSLMHRDLRPFAPWSEANPLLGLVSHDALHLGCLVSGALGAAVIGWQHWAIRNERQHDAEK